MMALAGSVAAAVREITRRELGALEIKSTSKFARKGQGIGREELPVVPTPADLGLMC
jgi:hypothetical protein